MRFSHCIIGKEGIDFGKKVEKQIRINRIEKALLERELDKVFLPSCKFTTHISTFDEDQMDAWSDKVIWSDNFADGGIVSSVNTAIGICNADCPVVIIHNKRDENYYYYDSLLLLHCGFRCLIPIFGQSIIEKAFRRWNLDPTKTEIFAGYSIGPCCYGLNSLPGTLFKIKHPQLKHSKATKGPRQGKVSISLYDLIEEQLEQMGVPKENIKIDRTCTACAGYHSNVYEGENAGRNLVLAWMHS